MYRFKWYRKWRGGCWYKNTELGWLPITKEVSCRLFSGYVEDYTND